MNTFGPLIEQSITEYIMKAALIQWGNTNKVTSPLYILISEQCEVCYLQATSNIIITSSSVFVVRFLLNMLATVE